MTAITFRQCFEGAWRDAWRLATRRPALVLWLWAVMLATGLADTALQRRGLPRAGTQAAALLRIRLLFGAVQLAALSGLAVQTMRFTLSGAWVAGLAAFLGRDFWRYLGLGAAMLPLYLAMSAAWLVAAAIVAGSLALFQTRYGLHDRSFVAGLVSGVLASSALVGVGAMAFVGARLSLLFCHVAVGRSARWRAAWSDTRGHCWSIWFAQGAVALSVGGAFAAFLLVGAIVLWGTRWQPQFAYVSALGQSVWAVASCCTSSACSAWLYRRFAATLLVARSAGR